MSDPAQFSLAITSDPQYPWYDSTLPTGHKAEDAWVKENSERQIREQYDDINAVAEARKSKGFPIKGVIVNGDLTAFGHDWQLDKWKELAKKLTTKFYPALGNHDYSNNVDDSLNNNCASRMVDYMSGWLNENANAITAKDDFKLTTKYLPVGTVLTGSLAYSFEIGDLHVVILNNYPAYQRAWTQLAYKRQYQITDSFQWLERDLMSARSVGKIIIVCTHS